MRRAIGIAACILLACLALSCLMGFDLPGLILVYTAIGWAFHIYHVAPRLAINWIDVGQFAAGLVALILAAHILLRWLYSAMRRPADQVEVSPASAMPARWPLRRSIVIVAMVLAVFAAGISMLGVAHQAVWLATYPGPMLGYVGMESNRRSVSGNNARNISLGALHYQAKTDQLPPGCTVDDHGEALHGWHTLLLPYLDQRRIYEQIDLESPWNAERNAPFFRQSMDLFHNPSAEPGFDSRGFAQSHYASNVLVLGGSRSLSDSDFVDGRSQTILLGEAAGNFRAWGHPAGWRDARLGLNRSPDGFGSPGRKRVAIGFADGSVKYVDDGISPAVLQALATPAGGEAVPREYRD